MFKYLLLFVALAISCCAGYFSITGISQLFIGAHISSIIMGCLLEASKILSISFLYRHYKEINKIQLIYLYFLSIVMYAITGFGVYGYLSSAYSGAAVTYKIQQSKIDVLTTQQNSINNILIDNQKSIDMIRNSITKQENRVDSLVGKNGFIIQQQNINQTNKRLETLQKENATIIKQRDSLELLKVQQIAQLSTNSKIGTFNYIAGILGVSLDTVAKWFILILVLVFDPISLNFIIFYNFIEKKERSQISIDIPSNSTPIEISEPQPAPIITEPSHVEVMAHTDKIKEREGVRIV